MRRTVSLLLVLTLLASTGCAASRAFRQGPPPIPIKFIGTAEKSGKKWAVFTDRPGVTVWAAEGETVLGQWKLVRIGVESVVMEYPNGTGRQTIPMRGGSQ
jgi:hypothetical protein